MCGVLRRDWAHFLQSKGLANEKGKVGHPVAVGYAKLRQSEHKQDQHKEFRISFPCDLLGIRLSFGLGGNDCRFH